MSSHPVVFPDYINDSDESLHGDDDRFRDYRGPRARRRDKRIDERNESPKPWRHFWLPQQPKYLDHIDKWYYYDSDDSEEITPKRKCMIGTPTFPNEPKVVCGKPSPEVLALHQARDQTNRDGLSHSCEYCNRFIVDLRRQAAVVTNRKYWDGTIANDWGGRALREIGYTALQAFDAAADGCVFFALLTRSMDPVYCDTYLSARGHTPRFRRQPIYYGFSMSEGSTPDVCFFIRRGTDGTLAAFFLYTVPGENPLHPILGYRLPPNTVANSELSFTRARRWLKECSLHHVRCRDWHQPYMPKRLIEISNVTGGNPPALHARLVTDPKEAPYSILSYCWGGDQPAKTTLARLQSYGSDIPLGQLPQTLQDAVVTTNELGLKYLWVDAMCIVQDDVSDVAEQIALMHHIYRGAWVTIAATNAASSRQGFLKQDPSYRTVKLRARLDDNVFGEVIGVPQYIKTGPMSLFTRGWTYQEALLSTRILAYGDRHLMFRCVEALRNDNTTAEAPMVLTEPGEEVPIGSPTPESVMMGAGDTARITITQTGPSDSLACSTAPGSPLGGGSSVQGVPLITINDEGSFEIPPTSDWDLGGVDGVPKRPESPKSLIDHKKFTKHLDENGSTHDQSPIDPGNTFLNNLEHPDSWLSAVRAYTKRELGVDNDKLLAIAAIAELYSNTKPVTTYLAGMWREKFLYQCLWQTATSVGTPTHTRPTEYRAPSWSWASVNGPIFHFGMGIPDEECSCIILDVGTTLINPQNRFGRVTAGFLHLRTKMRRVVWKNGFYGPSNCGLSVGDTKDRWEFWGGTDHRVMIHIDIAEEWPEGNHTTWCTEVRGGQGLMLEPVVMPNGEDNVFRRVGLAQYSSDRDNPYWFDDDKFEKYVWRDIVIV